MEKLELVVSHYVTPFRAWSADQRAMHEKLDRLAPREFEAPAGTSHPIDYAGPDAPAVEVRVQALFGCEAHPMIGDTPLLLAFKAVEGQARVWDTVARAPHTILHWPGLNNGQDVPIRDVRFGPQQACDDITADRATRIPFTKREGTRVSLTAQEMASAYNGFRAMVMLASG